MPRPDDDDADDFGEPLPDEVADDEYIPPAVEKRNGPGVFAVLLALVAAAGFAVVAYAPSRSFLNIDLRTSRTQERAPLFRLSVDGSGHRVLEVEGKAVAPRDAEMAPLPADVSPKGEWIRIVAIVGGAWVLLGMLTLLFAPGGVWHRRLTTLVPGIGISFAVALTVWSLGWLIKVVMLSRLIAERVEETPGLPRGGFQVDTQPAVGLFLALGGAIAAAVALSAVSQWCLRARWSQAFSGLGVLAGVIVLATVVQPWTAEPLWKVLFVLQ